MSRAAITLAATDETAGAFAAVKARLAGVGAEASALTARFASVAGGITALLGGVGLGAYFKQITDGIDRLNDLKDATGSSVGNLSALEDVAARTGTSFETVSAALVKFNGALSGAKAGTEAAEVFKRLGLDVAKLKAQDPAEAFRQVAVALKGFADDGDKARAVQVLFGRSLREVAPLLNDVAEAGRLNATVTEEQTQEAEKFNKQLAQLSKSAADAGRSLVSELLPGINRTLEAFNRARQSDRGLFGTFFDQLREDALRARLQGITDEIEAMTPAVQRAQRVLAETPTSIFAKQTLADFQALREKADQYREALDKVAPANEGGGRVNVQAPSIGDIGKGDKIKTQVSEFDKYLDKLRAGLLATQQLTAEEQTRIDINRGLLGVLSEGQKQQALALASALDSTRALQGSAKAYAALQEEGRRVTEGLRTEQEKLAETTARVEVLASAGVITWQTYARQVTGGISEAVAAVDQLAQSLPKLGPPLQGASAQARALAGDLRSALGESIVAALEGSSRRIEDIWKNLIKRLAAQAIEAQLYKLLFGEGYGSTTSTMGGLVEFLGSLGGGARASGGPVYAGRPYLVGEKGPELMVPRQSGTVLPNGAMVAAAPASGPVFNTYIQGDASASTLRAIRASQAQQAARLLNRQRY